MSIAKKRSDTARSSGVVRAHIRAGRKVRSYVRGGSRKSLSAKSGSKRNVMVGGGNPKPTTNKIITRSNRPIKAIDRQWAKRSAGRNFTPEKARAYREFYNTHRNRLIPPSKS